MPVSNFVARTEELVRLHAILGKGNGRRTAVLHGLGGMGKTQLALAYAKCHYTDYSAAIWLNAKDEAGLKQSFSRGAERIIRQYPSLTYLQNALTGRDLGQITQAVMHWLDEPKNDRWLLIYDNYDNPKFGTQQDESLETEMEELHISPGDSLVKAYDIRKYLPHTTHGSILITTRSSMVKIGQQVQLRKLGDIQDSLKILVSTSNRQELYDGKSLLLKWSNQF